MKKSAYLLFILLLISVFAIDFVSASTLDACNNPSFLRAIYIIKVL